MTAPLSLLASRALKVVRDLQTTGWEPCWPPQPGIIPYSLIRFDEAVPDHFLKLELIPIPLPDDLPCVAREIDATLAELRLRGMLARRAATEVVAVDLVRGDGVTVEVRPSAAVGVVLAFHPADRPAGNGAIHWACGTRWAYSITPAGLAVLDLHAAPPPRKSQPRRPRTPAGDRPTDRQMAAVNALAKNQGNRSAAAKELGISHVAFRKLIEGAYKRLPDLAPARPRVSRRPRRLPRDRRGQETI